MCAFGSVLVAATDGGIAVGIDAYLFGSLATVSKANVGLLLVMTCLVAGVAGAIDRPLLYATFDETATRAARVDVLAYNRLLVVLTAAVVVSAMQILGVVLVAAMLVVPVAAAAGCPDVQAVAAARRPRGGVRGRRRRHRLVSLRTGRGRVDSAGRYRGVRWGVAFDRRS